MRAPTTMNTPARTSTVSRWAAVRQNKRPNAARGSPTPQNPRAIGRYSFFRGSLLPRDGEDRDAAVGDDLLGRAAQEEPRQAADARRHDDELEAPALRVVDDAVVGARRLDGVVGHFHGLVLAAAPGLELRQHGLEHLLGQAEVVAEDLRDVEEGQAGGELLGQRPGVVSLDVLGGRE